MKKALYLLINEDTSDKLDKIVSLGLSSKTGVVRSALDFYFAELFSEEINDDLKRVIEIQKKILK